MESALHAVTEAPPSVFDSSDTKSFKAVGWSSVIRRPTQLTHDDGRRRHDVTTVAHALPAPLSKLPHHEEKLHEASTPASEKVRQIPNEAIFNTQFTTGGRKFLTNVKKNRTIQVDRRTKGFEN